jgi:peptidyl-prolyl cis-trans isomerase D
MLKTLRKKDVAKRILYVLAGIIIIAFVFLSPGSIIRSRQTANFAGKIFGKKISFAQYKDSLQAVKNQAIIKFGNNFYKIQKFLNLQKEAWDRLILLYEAKRRRIKVSDKEVVKKIKQLPFLQTNGKFDARLYQNVLNYIFKTPAREFEEQIRQSLMFEKLYEQVTNNVIIDEKEILENYKKENEKIRVSYVRFMTKDFLDEVTLEDKELKDYFSEHSSDFKRPPSVNVQYIGLQYPEKPTEEDKITIQNKIDEIYSSLEGQKDLQKISKQYSLPIKETGFFSVLDAIPDLGLQFEFNQAAFSLEDNQISKPVQTNKGIYILKLKEKKDSYIPTFEEVKDSVENILKHKKAAELAKNKAKEYLAKFQEVYRSNPNSFNFKKIVEMETLNYAQTPLFKHGEYVPDVGASKEFNEEAFSLKNKTKPFGFVSTQQGTYIIKLEEFIPIDEEKFAKEKEEFKNRLLQKKKDKVFNKFFLELKTKANLLDNISKIKSH